MAVRQSSRPSNLPQLPAVSEKLLKSDPQTYQLLKAMVEREEVRTGRGTDGDQTVTWNDLASLGFDISAKNATETPYNFSNNRLPVERWDDLRFPIEALRLSGTKPPLETLLTIDSSSYLVLAFEDALTANEEKVYFTGQMPHAWKYGTNIFPHVHWMGEDTTAGNVRWRLDYTIADVNGVFTSSNTLTVEDANKTGAANTHNIVGLGEIDMTGFGLSAILLCELRRESGNAADTFTSKDAYLLEIDFHFQRDKFGSIQEYTNKRG